MLYCFGSATFDTDARLLSRDGEAMRLSGKAIDLLQLLIEERPRAIAKEELHDRMWPDTFVVQGSLAVLISEIRAALGDSRDVIRTVHRFGYAFAGDVTVGGDGSTPSANGVVHQLVLDRQVIRLAYGRNVIGRDAAAEVCIPSISVSRRHAAVTTADDTAVVEDLSSKNGTRVDGVMITGPTPLRHGSVIRLGEIELRYLLVSSDTRTESVIG